MNKEEFIKLTKELEIDFTEKQLRELEIYKNFLIEYNNHTNLTAIKDEPGIYLKHFYDSLTLYPYIKEKQKILDIGTGAGFPGMVLAITCPEKNFILLDANNKKINFLQELQTKLQLTNIECVHDRAENYVRNHREEFDAVTSRAVAELRILTELSLPALKIGGIFLPMKSNIEEELENAKDTIELLNGKRINQISFELPIEHSKRAILIIEHSSKTDCLYPRTYDKILKKPLKKRNK